MSLQKHSERQHDFNIFPKTRQDFTTKSKKFKEKLFEKNVPAMHIQKRKISRALMEL